MGESVLNRSTREETEKRTAKSRRIDEILARWQRRYTDAKSSYDHQLQKFRTEELEYDGSSRILPVAGSQTAAVKKALIGRNAVYELIETEIDSTIPAPKVTALHPEDDTLAHRIEGLVSNVLEQLPVEAINDSNERETYLHGGSFVHIEWDLLAGLHETLGMVTARDLATRQVIPQPGCEWLDECDWYFIVQPMNRERVKREFKKSVEYESEAEPEARQRGDTPPVDTTGMVTVITAFYRSDSGSIGKYTWCGDTVLEDSKDYLQKQQRVCSKCGAVITGETCSVCGGEKWTLQAAQELPLDKDVVIQAAQPDGSRTDELLHAQTVTELQPLEFDETGAPSSVAYQVQQTMIPTYRIRHYPTLMRKNISAKGKFMGVSDVQVILPMQEAVKKLDTKILEKLLKGGSYVTLPQGVNVETTDRELKVVRVKTAAEKALIDVLTVQPNIANDLTLRNTYYDDMKSTLGISDSYQGKQDTTATSGTAKQISVNQAAGRLESKRIMKQQLWAHIYRAIFEHWLLFSDDLACIRQSGQNGGEYQELTKWDFLRRDVSGRLYWNDEFIFDVDIASTSPADRASMQDKIRADFQAGMFGDTASVESRIRLWKMMLKYHAPGARDMLDMAMEELAQQQQAQARQLQESQQAAQFAARQAAAEQAMGTSAQFAP